MEAIILLCCWAGHGSVPTTLLCFATLGMPLPQGGKMQYPSRIHLPLPHVIHRAARRVPNEAPVSAQCSHRLLDGRSGTAPIA